MSSMGISVPAGPSPSRTTQHVVVIMSLSASAALTLFASWVKRRTPEMTTMMPMMMAVEGSASPAGAMMTLVYSEMPASTARIRVKGLTKDSTRRLSALSRCSSSTMFLP